jgi:hypothetical protein
MLSKVTRGEQILEAVKQTTGMTEAGKEWLKIAIDPFHDVPDRTYGYPDQDVASSVVLRNKQQISLVSPYANTETWGALIYLDDYCVAGKAERRPDDLALRNAVYMNNETAVTGNLPYGGLNIVTFDQTAFPTGNQFWAPPSPGATQNKITQYSFPEENYVGKTRVISSGFEVHNVTEPLYKSGTVTTFNVPTVDRDLETISAIFSTGVAVPSTTEVIYVENRAFEEEITVEKCKEIFGAVPADSKYYYLGKKGKTYVEMVLLHNKGQFSAKAETVCPKSIAEAMLLKGTKSWEASKGAYMVQRMSSLENPAGFPEVVVPLFTDDDNAWPVFSQTAGTPKVWLPDMELSTEISSGNILIPVNRRKPYNKCGLYFSGLSPQTKLTINWNEYIEKFLSTQDTTLITLANNSPPEDIVAKTLYTRLADTLPPACPVEDNGLGDWFSGAMELLGSISGSPLVPLMTEGFKALGRMRETGSVNKFSNITGRGEQYDTKRQIALIEKKDPMNSYVPRQQLKDVSYPNRQLSRRPKLFPDDIYVTKKSNNQKKFKTRKPQKRQVQLIEIAPRNKKKSNKNNQTRVNLRRANSDVVMAYY